MRIKTLLCLIIASFLSVSVWAWGLTGHRVVGQIADSYLTPKAKAAIHKILGNESVAISSNWADFIKSDSTMTYLSPWHYINAPVGLSYADFANYLKNDTATDAFTRINFLIKELKNKKLDAVKKKMYLRLLIHIVGDVHQPMHVGRAEDQGGNKIKVQWFNESTNLHSVWDDKIIEMQKLSYTEYAANINHSTLMERRKLQQQPIEKWLYESYHLADTVYSGITQPDQKLGYRYNFDNIVTVNQQLLKGGIRLAGLLNELFK